MISFYVQGGLGNQLFQYATARRMSLKYDCSLILDGNWFLRLHRNETQRELELKKYHTEFRSTTNFEKILLSLFNNKYLRRIIFRFVPGFFYESGESINKRVLKGASFAYLNGFWQSEEYFSDIREELLKELTPVEPPSAKDSQLIDLMNQTESVSVHIRRGDYVSSSVASAYHGTCSLVYYQNAIDEILKSVANPTFFVFSDDIEWVKENLKISFPTWYVDHNTPETAFQDLRLMSTCRHHIIANSSFSWWGAWLSQREIGIVIAPERWYADNRPVPNLLPKHWIKLPS